MNGFGLEQLALTSMEMQPQQRISTDQVQAWQMHPWQILEPEHPVFTRMIIKRGGRAQTLERLYKKIRDEQILGDVGSVININIIGPNGAGKGILGQGFAEAIRRDEYMHDMAQQQGFKVVVLADLFAINIKALQLARLQRTPWAVPDGIQHGQFSPDHYQKADDFSMALREEIHRDIPSNVKIVKISERPAPTAYPVDRTVPPKLEGVNRAHGSVYADAYDPRTRASTNFFILQRDPKVRDMANDDRTSYQMQGVENPFTGHNKYWLTSKAGAIYDVSTLSPTLQSEILALLRLGSASPAAMVRGDSELDERADKLFAQRKISSPTIDTYLRFIHKKLISTRKDQPGLPASRVHLVENVSYSGRPEYHFNNLTHNNRLIEMYPELLEPNLRNFVFGK